MRLVQNYRINTWIWFIIFLLTGCQDDPGLVVNGALFSAEDLVVDGEDTFSYQQALGACPEGWSLATLEDWQALLERYGGYNNAGEIVGDPGKSFSSLTAKDGFNALKTFYWTASPAWLDAPFIRSSTILFDEMNKEVSKGALLVGATLPCRCVNRPAPVTEDFVAFTLPKGFVKYDFYEFYVPDSPLLSVYLHRILESGTKEDRIIFSLALPNEFVAVTDTPVEPTAVYVSRSFNYGDSMFDADGFDFFQGEYDGSLVKFLITFYDGQVVKGTFSGNTWEGIPIQDGSFSIHVN